MEYLKDLLDLAFSYAFYFEPVGGLLNQEIHVYLSRLFGNMLTRVELLWDTYPSLIYGSSSRQFSTFTLVFDLFMGLGTSFMAPSMLSLDNLIFRHSLGGHETIQE